MGIEDVHVFQTQAAQALVETCQKVLPGTPFAVWSRPHEVACFGRDDELIAIAGEVFAEHSPEVLFGRTGWRPIVVGQIKMGDSKIEGAQDDIATHRVVIDIAKVVPKTKRDARQHQAAATGARILHRVVASGGSCVAHEAPLRTEFPPRTRGGCQRHGAARKIKGC